MGLDQARAIAIIAMMAAHFAPGAFLHLPDLEALRGPILGFSRIATPGFVTVFGATAGFALLPRFVRGKPGDAGRRLRRRAGLVLLAAIAITLPAWASLATHANPNPWVWVFGLYSVLLFYAVALAVLPFWLTFLARRTVPRAVLAGSALWALGTAIDRVWPVGPPSAPSLVRLLLVGDYGYLQMMGTAILAAPVGLWLRRAWDAGGDRRVLLRLTGFGLALAAAGLAWGIAIGDYDLARLVAGELKVPPRAWYFLLFGGLTLSLVGGLDLFTRGVRMLDPVGYVLALAGQTALALYTGHMFVLPALALVDRYTPLRGSWRVTLPLLAFLLFCVVVVYLRHRRLTQERPASEPAVRVPAPDPEPALAAR